MTDATHTPRPTAPLFPALSIDTVLLMLIAGAAATLAFDLWGQAIAPWLGLGNLAPVGLATGFLNKLGLPGVDRADGVFMHLFAIGLIAYPAGWLFVFRPLWARVVGFGGWLLPATLYGAALWVFAIGLIAGWVTGNPFLGFARIAWVALAGHVFYALVLAAVAARLETRTR